MVRLLFLLGVTLDGVGALLIAFPILQPGSAAREVTRPRWGGNLWEPVQRTRERRLVQYGALFLAGGFCFQAVAYLWTFHSARLLAGLLVVVVVGIGVFVGTRLASRDLPRHVWYEETKPRDAIADQRQIFSVSTIKDWRALHEQWIAQEGGKPIEETEERSAAFVEGGAWLVNHPRCHNPAFAWPSNPHAICRECRVRFGVDFPPAELRERIERALIREPDPERRRWVIGDPDV